MAEGVVKSFNAEKGWGFLTSLDPPITGDVFVHYTAIQTTGYKMLDEGQYVSFDIHQGPHGLMTTKVTPLGAPGDPLPDNLLPRTPAASSPSRRRTQVLLGVAVGLGLVALLVVLLIST